MLICLIDFFLSEKAVWLRVQTPVLFCAKRAFLLVGVFWSSSCTCPFLMHLKHALSWRGCKVVVTFKGVVCLREGGMMALDCILFFEDGGSGFWDGEVEWLKIDFSRMWEREIEGGQSEGGGWCVFLLIWHCDMGGVSWWSYERGVCGCTSVRNISVSGETKLWWLRCYWAMCNSVPLDMLRGQVRERLYKETCVWVVSCDLCTFFELQACTVGTWVRANGRKWGMYPGQIVV